MTVKIEDFRHLVSEDMLNSFGPLVQSFPKWTFERSPWSQLGMAAVGAAMAVVCLVVSFQVVVSNMPEEQLPFQQAMWGFAGVAGILMLYGLGTGLWRAIFGISSVGQWWLLLERGLIIVKNGKADSYPLNHLRIKSAVGIGNKPQLLDANDRSLALPLNAEEALIMQIVELQRRARQRRPKRANAAPLRPDLGRSKMVGRRPGVPTLSRWQVSAARICWPLCA